MTSFPRDGEAFGPYVIDHKLGQGGMGVVFAAREPALGRMVALKVIAPTYGDDAEFRSRFVREATVMASLDSPHVLAIYGHGEHNGLLYMATQLVTGGDLANRLRSGGPLSPPDAVEVVAQIASALSDAHAAGIVHRDVKPSNVLLRGGSDIFAYLCDFGIAHTTDQALTRTGSVVGTFAYLAPECCVGEPSTPASDQYALGCVLYAALTGRPPYSGTDYEVAHQHVNAPVPQIAESSAYESALNAVLRQSLAKHPQHRYPNLAAMRDALHHLGAGQHAQAWRDVEATRLRPPPGTLPMTPATPSAPTLPVAAPGVPAPGPTARRSRAPWMVAGTAVAALLVVVAGIVGYAISRDGSPATSATGRTTPDVGPSFGAGPTTTPAADPPPLTGMGNAQYLNQPCNDKWIVLLATAGTPEDYASKLQDAVRESSQYPPKYLTASKSCTAFLQHSRESGQVSEIYNAYLGPFNTMEQACSARASLRGINAPLAWVRQLREGSPKRLLCVCEDSISSLPVVSPPGPGGDDYAVRRDVADAQYVLLVNGLNPERRVSGMYPDAVAAMFAEWQSARGLTPTGTLDRGTWTSLMADFCSNPRSE